MYRAIIITICFAFLANGIKNETRPASLKFGLAKSGIQEIQNLANPIITEAILSAQIPNISVHAVGIHVTVSNITVTSLDLGQEKVVLQPPSTLTISTSNCNINAKMAWRYHDGLIDIKGTAVDIMNETELSISLGFGAQQGRLGVDITSLEVDIKKFKIILDGGHGGIYQALVDIIEGPLKDTFQKLISKEVKSTVNSLLAKYLPLVPVNIPIVQGLELDYSLINASSRHFLVGKSYSNNHFGGDSKDVSYSNFDINIDAYDSIDVMGYFRPDVDGQYAFQIYFNQAGQIDAANQTAGHLELHNPGMCWANHHTDTTAYFNATAGKFYPIRLRYQGGCGGGHIEVRLCIFNESCSQLQSLNVTSDMSEEMPLLITPDTILTASGAEFFNTSSPIEAPFPHVQLPTQLLPSFNESLDMIALYLDPFLFSSFFYVLDQDNFLDFSVNNTSLPPAIKQYFQLNTTFFRFIFPELYKKFPNDEMQLDGSPDALYAFEVIPDKGILGGLSYAMNVSVLQGSHDHFPMELKAHQNVNVGLPTPDKIPAMRLKFNATVQGETYIANQTIHIDIGPIDFSINLEWAVVPIANISALNPIIQNLLDKVILPAINHELAPGFPIPLLGPLELVNTKVEYFDEGFIGIKGAVKAVNTTSIPFSQAPVHKEFHIFE